MLYSYQRYLSNNNGEVFGRAFLQNGENAIYGAYAEASDAPCLLLTGVCASGRQLGPPTTAPHRFRRVLTPNVQSRESSDAKLFGRGDGHPFDPFTAGKIADIAEEVSEKNNKVLFMLKIDKDNLGQPVELSGFKVRIRN
eukprot:8286476-Pyramimonas_sp.AAC.2